MTSSRMDYGNMANRILILAYVIFYLLASTGCDNPSPTPDPKPDAGIVIQAPAFNDDQDILALAMAKQSGGISPAPAPGPTPVGPKVGDTCEDCSGTGKVGDGTIFKPCKPCMGDGKLDLGDPGLSSTSQVTPVTVIPHTHFRSDPAASSSPSQEKAAEHSIVTSEALEQLRDDMLKGHSDQEQAIDTLSQEIKTVTEKTQQQPVVPDDLQKTVDDLTARVNQLEATLKAAEQREAEAVKQLQQINEQFKSLQLQRTAAPAAKPSAATAYHYRILWKGVPYIWEQDQLAFVAADGHRISFTEMGPIAEQNSVQVCQNTPQGRICTWVPVERHSGSPPAKQPAIIAPQPSTSINQPAVGNSSQKSSATGIAPATDGAKIAPDNEAVQPSSRDGINIPAPVPADLSANRSHASIDAYLQASTAKLLRRHNRDGVYLQGSSQALQFESAAGVTDSGVRLISLPVSAN